MKKEKDKQTISKKAYGGQTFEKVFGEVIKYAKWVLLLAIVLICLSGIYKVDTGEVAVILRFGKLSGSTYAEQIKKPGLHMAFPYVIDEVVKIPVDKIQEKTITTHYESNKKINSTIRSTGYLITGDENIVLIETKIKYKISNPIDYALYINDLDGIIDGIISSESTSIVANLTIDDVLTVKKTEIVNKLKLAAQEQFDEISCGIELTSVELTSVGPPLETNQYFENVNAAAIQKETLIRQAEQYAASKVPQAESEAQKIIEEALVDQQNQLIVTNAEMAQFYGLYEQYLINPETVENGIFRERVSVVLSQMGAVIIVPKDGKPPIIILP